MIILTKLNRNNIDILYNEVITNLLIKYRNFILYNNRWYDYPYDYDEYEKFKDYYKRYFYSSNILLGIEYLNYSGEFHREDGPTYIQYYKNGGIHIKIYFLNDKEYSYEDYLLEIKKMV